MFFSVWILIAVIFLSVGVISYLVFYSPKPKENQRNAVFGVDIRKKPIIASGYTGGRQFMGIFKEFKPTSADGKIITLYLENGMFIKGVKEEHLITPRGFSILTGDNIIYCLKEPYDAGNIMQPAMVETLNERKYKISKQWEQYLKNQLKAEELEKKEKDEITATDTPFYPVRPVGR